MPVEQGGQDFIEAVGARARGHGDELGFVIRREAGAGIGNGGVCMGHEDRSYNSACHPNTKDTHLVIFRPAAPLKRPRRGWPLRAAVVLDRKSTRLNSSH